MDKMYCTNCGDELQMWEMGDGRMCLGCWSSDGFYYGTEAGMMLKMMRAEMKGWREFSGNDVRIIGLN